MNRRRTSVASLVGAGMLLGLWTSAPPACVSADELSESHDRVAEWHIRLRGTKA
jgi:hypothetical protein